MANDRWQYQVVNIKPGWSGCISSDKLQEQLNQFGRVGWELVAVHQGQIGGMKLFLKKPM
jgi:hypothetical protein